MTGLSWEFKGVKGQTGQMGGAYWRSSLLFKGVRMQRPESNPNATEKRKRRVSLHWYRYEFLSPRIPLIPYSFLYLFLSLCLCRCSKLSPFWWPWIHLRRRAKRSKRNSRKRVGGFLVFEGGRGGDTRRRYETLLPKRGIGWAPSTLRRKPPWPTTEPHAQCVALALAPTSSTPTCHRAPPSPPSSPLTSPSLTSPPTSSLPPLNPTPIPTSSSIPLNAINSHSRDSSPRKPTPGIIPIFTRNSLSSTTWTAPPPPPTTNSTMQTTSPHSLPRFLISSRVQVSKWSRRHGATQPASRGFRSRGHPQMSLTQRGAGLTWDSIPPSTCTAHFSVGCLPFPTPLRMVLIWVLPRISSKLGCFEVCVSFWVSGFGFPPLFSVVCCG